MKNTIVALLLAGGNSSRLWPLEDKYTLDFLGKPLAYYSIRQLERFGIYDVVIVVNEKNFPIFERLKSDFSKIRMVFVKQTDSRGMAGAVVSAEAEIAGKPVLIISPSDVYEDDIFIHFDNLRSKHPDGIIAGITKDTYFPGGYLTVSSGRVTTLTEKPDPKNLPSNIVSFVFHYFNNASTLIEEIETLKGTKENLYERAIDTLIRNGSEFKYLHYKSFWGYLKYPWDCLSLSSYFLSRNTGKIGGNVKIAKGVTLSGKIQIEDGVTILEGAKIVGPTYIGRGTLIGNNTVIRESMIGSRCVVGFATEIVRSSIGNDCWFHSNYIGDSILSHNIGLGAGAVVANFKLNETTVSSTLSGKKVDTGRLKLGAAIGENVRIGIHASLMPGVKIGKNSHIGSAVLIDRDIGENVYCAHLPSTFVEKKVTDKKPVRLKDIHAVHFS
ncbi:NTP transferase domain-containing protein [Candidatus Gottesmanbacteria bacterium]|nr:NTP transferase domain-containing protein [Candidatus Gottesmanbacteria bacterium]